jgi:molecular chaperone GrpE
MSHDEVSGGDAAENSAGERSLEEELATLQGDLERFRDLAMRSQADFENYRKRALREKEEAVKYANAGLLERLVPIVDNFQLGLSAARDAGGQQESSILSGMEMIEGQLREFLADAGVEPIEAEGKRFDPNLHEAISQEPSDDVEEGKISRQLRRGYKLKDRLLRPASVVVSKGRVK